MAPSFDVTGQSGPGVKEQSNGLSNGGTQLKPSSSGDGFFQIPPRLMNQFHDDPAFQRAFEAFLPEDVRNAVSLDLSRSGADVISPEIFAHVSDAERNLPYIKTWDMWGRRVDEVVLSNGWINLRGKAIEEGLMAIPYQKKHGRHSRMVQFAKMNLWCGSSAATGYNSTFADGASQLLLNYMKSPNIDKSIIPMLNSAYERLVSTDPETAWTSGLFMTERSGGSDVSGTETVAVYKSLTSQDREASPCKDASGYELGPWEINGFKFFSSGTESSMAILLARTQNGVSAFYAPMRIEAIGPYGEKTTKLNGVHIQRLKQKLGTRANTTAELELKGMRAWLLGEEGKGTREVATMLNVTRLHIGINALGYWARGLAAARAFTRVRKVARGMNLRDVPLHMAVLAREHILYRGAMMLLSFAGALLGKTEEESPTQTSHEPINLIPAHKRNAELLLRLLVSAVKATSARAAINGLAHCMEFLGGVGYLENEQMDFNIARVYRDASVLGIVDGTTNVLATDLVNVVTGKAGTDVLNAFQRWVESSLAAVPKLDDEVEEVRTRWRDLREEMGQSRDFLMTNAVEVMENITAVATAVILLTDAGRDGDVVAVEVARRWLRLSFGAKALLRQPGGAEQLEMNRRIVFGDAM